MSGKKIIIAEIGCNHKGDMNIAKEMIKVAAQYCQVDAVKFQKRHNKELLSPEEYNAPHPVPYNSYGNTYGEHREFLEFNLEQHAELKKMCEYWGVIYSTSVWDITSAKEISVLQPAFVKIPSACNLDFELLDFVLDNYKNEIHISLGMTTLKEEEEIVDFLIKKQRNKDVVLFSCVSGYPVEIEDLALLEIVRLKEKYKNIVKCIGFSGHHAGISPDVAAMTLGAEYFERHFTLNRTWKGTDHAASLEPEGMRRVARDVRNVAKALTYKPYEITKIEEEQRAKLKRKITLS
jgi:N-acetylneuraminate synthase